MSANLEPRISNETADSLMVESLGLAAQASANKEVPVGAVIWKDGAIIARAHNRIEERCDATAHAEILAIQDASKALGNWRLEGCVLCVTLEPCSMCAGAITQARIPVVIFGASDKKFGAVGSRYDLSTVFPFRVIQGVREKESLDLLNRFFSSLRA